MKNVQNSAGLTPGSTYPMRKPISIWGAIKANFYFRFRPSKLAFTGIERCEVVRLPDGTVFTLPVPRQRATNPQAMPVPPAHLIVCQGENPAPLFDDEGASFGADNMPEECSPEAPQEEDLVDSLHKRAAELEAAANAPVPSTH